MLPIARKMFRGLGAILALSIVDGIGIAPVVAADRVALVIGNQEYRSAPKLAAPRADATDVAATLVSLGFRVVGGTQRDAPLVDATKPALEAALATFSDAASRADIALVYYSGHAVQAQLRGQAQPKNWLVPVDARIPRLSLLPSQAINVQDSVLGLLRARVLNLLILDACRDNPFLGEWQQQEPAETRNLGGTKGLTRMEGPGVLIAYSARDGETARDRAGGDRNSPYTSALLKHLGERDLAVQFLFGRTRATLRQMPDAAQQNPVEYGEMPGDPVYLAARIPPPHRPEPAPMPIVHVHPTPSPLPAPGVAFRDCAECPEMVTIPAGSFIMGTPATEAGRENREGPQHRVTMRLFALGKYEVTFAEWDVCAAAGGCSDRPSGQVNKSHPVGVSYADAQQYVQWLSQRTGTQYRLPSEAEWEYAARAGTTQARYWGEGIGVNQANCVGCGSQWEKQTAPVGSFGPNRFGLHDMIGNVWEWAEDCWNENYTEAPSDGSARVSGDCSYRVVRGGSYYGFQRNARSGSRIFWYPTGSPVPFIGFRVARSD